MNEPSTPHDTVGAKVGLDEGEALGDTEGLVLGLELGLIEGAGDGRAVGGEGLAVGASVVQLSSAHSRDPKQSPSFWHP